MSEETKTTVSDVRAIFHNGPAPTVLSNPMQEKILLILEEQLKVLRAMTTCYILAHEGSRLRTGEIK